MTSTSAHAGTAVDLDPLIVDPAVCGIDNGHLSPAGCEYRYPLGGLMNFDPRRFQVGSLIAGGPVRKPFANTLQCDAHGAIAIVLPTQLRGTTVTLDTDVALEVVLTPIDGSNPTDSCIVPDL